MSTYAVNLVGKRVLKDAEFRQRLLDDPEAALGELDLDDAEREALLAGDVARLYEMGAHEYLLMSLGRCGVLGLDMPTYSERIRKATPRLDY
jgi:Aromatic-ring-opening dioxygenase LigAB, LigA subunit